MVMFIPWYNPYKITINNKNPRFPPVEFVFFLGGFKFLRENDPLKWRDPIQKGEVKLVKLVSLKEPKIHELVSRVIPRTPNNNGTPLW